MGLFDPIAALAFCTVLVLALLLWRRRHTGQRQRSQRRDALDTVQDWPPEAARVLTIAERRAYDLLRNALPGFLILAQVPLSRFLRSEERRVGKECW